MRNLFRRITSLLHQRQLTRELRRRETAQHRWSQREWPSYGESEHR